jgi:UDP-N-acetylglucosamine acyltransferase
MLGGHCEIDDFVTFSGGAAAHQFVRVGAHAFITGLTGVADDVIPFALVNGRRGSLAGLNYIGLKRHGFSPEAIQTLRRAFKQMFFGPGTLKERIEDIAAAFADEAPVQQMIAFIRAGGDRPICIPREGKEEDE